MTHAIEVEAVEAGYRDAPILNDVSFAIAEGDMVAVIGPNGAGKTTLLRVLTGLVRPTQGAVRLFAKDVASLSARRRAQWVGVVPQAVETPMAFTVREIVMMGRTAALSGWGHASEGDRRIAERAMVYTDTAHMRDRPFAQLSGGEKQRVIIAMVLAQEPRLVLMDEATSHLDINHRIEIMEIVERLNAEEGTTVLMVSHDLNLSAEFCRRLILMDHGQVVSDGAPADVLKEETLRRVYHCDVRVQRNPANGSVSVLPAPRFMPEHSGKGIRVHLIAGGGCGAEVLRRLSLAEYSVTCGVLNRGDSDAEACAALDVETALEVPFSAIGPESLARAREMAERADVVIVCAVPFGPGNVANLDIAERAARLGRSVIVFDGLGERDYTPDRAAVARFERLKGLGARTCGNVADLVGLLPAGLKPGPCLKGKFPFRLGTTSYIIPADFVPNVAALADRVDDVELLLFESDEISNLPSAETVAELGRVAARKDLTFTVHLPMDVMLGDADDAVRRRSVDTCLRILDLMRPVQPFGYVLHFHGERDRPLDRVPSANTAGWLGALDASVREILASGVDPASLCVETLAYPFELVEAVVSGHGLSVCLDLGHLLLYDYPVADALDRYLPRTRIIHLHGVREGVDHRDIAALPADFVSGLLDRLKATREAARVLTLEVFGREEFLGSMELMAQWV